MRRPNQQLPKDACEEILHRCASGTLALCGTDGMPYAVPLNYVYHDGHIYFHGATEGHKMDLIRQNPKVSFCVIGKDELISEEYTTRYASVIAFGTARIVEETEEKRAIMMRLMGRLAATVKQMPECVGGSLRSVALVDIAIAEMTGKRSED